MRPKDNLIQSFFWFSYHDNHSWTFSTADEVITTWSWETKLTGFKDSTDKYSQLGILRDDINKFWSLSALINKELLDTFKYVDLVLENFITTTNDTDNESDGGHINMMASSERMKNIWKKVYSRDAGYIKVSNTTSCDGISRLVERVFKRCARGVIDEIDTNDVKSIYNYRKSGGDLKVDDVFECMKVTKGVITTLSNTMQYTQS